MRMKTAAPDNQSNDYGFEQEILAYKYTLRLILYLVIPLLGTLMIFVMLRRNYPGIAILSIMLALNLAVLMLNRTQRTKTTKIRINRILFKAQVIFSGAYLLWMIGAANQWELVPWIFVICHLALVITGLKVGVLMSSFACLSLLVIYLAAPTPVVILTDDLMFRFFPAFLIAIILFAGVEYIRNDYRRKLAQANLTLSESKDKYQRLYEKMSGEVSDRKQAEQALWGSEARFRLIAENVADVIWTMDINLNFTYVSPSIYQQRGYTVAEAMQQPLEQVVMPDSLAMILTQFAEKLTQIEAGDEAGFEPAEFEVEQPCKDGSTIWTSNHARIMPGPNKEAVGVLGITRDITERRQTEEELLRLNQFRESIIDNANIWLNVLDEQGNVVVWNKAAESISGYTREEVVGHDRIWEWCYPDADYREEMMARTAAVIAENEVLEDFETTIRTRGGQRRDIAWHSRSLSDESGNPMGSIAMGRDITAQKMAMEALQKSEDRLLRSKKMESLGLLAGGVAHDLNNVLSGIVSYPELLLMELPAGSKLRKPIETIQESGHRAAAIVQDLLTVARGVAVAKEPMNLNEMVSDYLRSPEFEALKQTHSDVTVESDLDPELLFINGSPVHLRKVVMNLIANAAEAVQGIGRVAITTDNRYLDTPLKGCDAVEPGEYAVLNISDNGPGISPEDLQRIFEPFYTKKAMGRSGTGLGLAVVWNTVQDHKGYIDLSTNSDQTSFELYFPITREEIPTQRRAVPIEEFKGDGERILVIDDVASQREISCKMLDTLGYEARAVESGEEAVAYLREHTVDLLLLDMIMDPGINGRETYARVLELNPYQKAIIVSGFAKTEEVQKTQALGAGKYVKKPLTLKRLGMAIKEELRR